MMCSSRSPALAAIFKLLKSLFFFTASVLLLFHSPVFADTPSTASTGEIQLNEETNGAAQNVPSNAQAPEELLETANEAYRAGHYFDAIEGYQRAGELGLWSPDLLYNLGNAYYRKGEVGRAILCYRRALLEEPNDPDLRFNLEFARKRLRDKLGGAEADGWRQNLAAPLAVLGESNRLLFGVMLSFLLWTLIAIDGFFRHGLIRALTAIFMVLYLSWCGLYFGTDSGRDGRLRFTRFSEQSEFKPAVVVAEEAKGYSGDGESFQVVFVLHQGAEVAVNEIRGDWFEVILPEGRRGWIQSPEIELIQN